MRRVALVGFLVYAASTTVLSVERFWLSGGVPWPPLPDGSKAWVQPAPTGPWPTLAEYAGLVWLGAFLALVFGRRRAAAIFAVVGVLLPLAEVTRDVTTGREPMMLALVRDRSERPALVALAAFHGDAPPVRRGPWLGAFGVGLLLGGVPGGRCT